jgi:hypothetical protein
MTVSTPLNLQILKMVMQYQRLPLPLLYQRLTASQAEIKQQVDALVQKGALKVEDECLILR